jgi:hypothetical protein
MTERVMDQVMTNSVTIRFKQTGGEWRVVGGGSAKSHSNTVPFGESQEFVFLLTQDMINQGYQFDTKDPIWVGVDNGQCPTSFDPNGPISLNGAPSASQIRVNDANTDPPVVLRYQLNVLDPQGKSDPIDPIIDNRGGGGSLA